MFRESRYKFDVSVNLDLTVNYERNYTYTFDPTQSTGKEDDLVNVLNLPLIVGHKSLTDNLCEPQ